MFLILFTVNGLGSEMMSRAYALGFLPGAAKRSEHQNALEALTLDINGLVSYVSGAAVDFDLAQHSLEHAFVQD